ncbi:MAG: GNAT family N-acetyltransferase [Pirellulales bacterium]|nr:GNAT family N-acetyltransferase [Pirellulales bacterium]
MDIWQSRHVQAGLFGPMTVDLIEQFVLSKLYFEPSGLVLAREDDRPVGFAHAGFGPTDDEADVSRELGTTCLILVRPDCDEARVAAGLLNQCETYLAAAGAKVLYGGAMAPLDPFYHGFYGGSELPGILATDQVARGAFESSGYKEIDRTVLFRGNLHSYEPPTGRQQLLLRREMLVHVVNDPPYRSWWECCATGGFERTRFELRPRLGGDCVAHAVVRNMDPTQGLGGAPSAGLTELHVDAGFRKRGLSVFLLAEVFHHLTRMGVDWVELQTMSHNTAALGLYERLGFEQVNEGIVFRKESPLG